MSGFLASDGNSLSFGGTSSLGPTTGTTTTAATKTATTISSERGLVTNSSPSLPRRRMEMKEAVRTTVEVLSTIKTTSTVAGSSAPLLRRQLLFSSSSSSSSLLSIETQATALLDLLQGPDGSVWSDQPNRKGWTTSTIDELCSMPWEGITCSDNNDAVEQLTLPSSGLVATLPESLGLLSGLTHIDLSNNKLVGLVPSSITKLPNLVEVNLSNNQDLRGPLPVFDTTTKLEVLNLSQNKFVGSLPPDFGTRLSSSWKTLKELNLSANSLYGGLPPDINQLTSLKVFDISHNRFSGPIPPQSLSRLSAIETINLHDNKFTGTIPTSLADLYYLNRLTVHGNKFVGTVPKELCDKKLGENKDTKDCSALACPVGTYSESHGASPTCKECEEGSSNPYLGASSCFPSDPLEILKEFYASTNGDSWSSETLDNPWKVEDDGENPCDWSGIACNGSGDVTGIVLPDHDLKGSITSSLGMLTHLEVLDLSNNKLGGDLPSDLHFAPLQSLDVSNNELVGVVPPALCHKEGLNGNGEGGFTGWLGMGTYECEAVACPMNTYSQTGQGPSCIPCLEGTTMYLASTSCNDGGLKVNDAAMSMFASDGIFGGTSSSSTSSWHVSPTYKAGAMFAMLLVSALSVCFLCGGYWIFQKRRKMMLDVWNIEDERLGGMDSDFEDGEDASQTSLGDVKVLVKRSPSPEEEVPPADGSVSGSAAGSAGSSKSLGSIGKSSAGESLKKAASAVLGAARGDAAAAGGGNNNNKKTYITSDLDEFPTTVQAVSRTKNAWSSGKEKTNEVWLDVPKIS